MEPTTPQPEDKLSFDYIFEFIGKTIDAAERFDKMATGALISTTGGSVVIGLVMGGIFWLPLGLTLPLLGYRLVTQYREREERKTFRLIQVIATAKSLIYESNLPDDEKRLLSDQLNQLLPQADLSKMKNLSPPS
jgi:hypothetical protein